MGVYELCKKYEKDFEKFAENISERLKNIATQLLPNGIPHTFSRADIKKETRCFAKFVEKYHLDASALTDILRCSFIFDDVKKIQEAIMWVDDFSRRDCNGEPIENPLFEIVRIKDRFTER